jgi:poly(A) polymerase
VSRATRENAAVNAPPARLAPLLGAGTPLQELAGLITAAGYECHLVGGSVRDVFCDRAIGDLDLATDARPDRIEQIVGPWADHLWLQGKRYGTVGAKRHGVVFEITTYRAEVYHADSRKPDVQFGDDIGTDLGRRDFTVNAMALRLPDLELVDPYGGLADLAQRRLRTPLAVDVSFTDDPLRMLRAARFASQLGFTPDDAVVEAMGRMRGRLEIVSAERIRDELTKLLVTDDPGPGLWLVARTRLADEFFPELNAMSLEQDPIHRHKDVLTHTIAVVQKTRAELVVRLAALLHDIGKPKTRGYSSRGVTFHHHEVVGARMARERLTAWRYPNEIVEAVTQLVYLHLRFHTYRMGWTDAAVRRYVRDAGELLDELNHLTRCDCTTRNVRKAAQLARRMDELESRIAELREREELARIRPPLDGRQVMAHLGIGPGPLVGKALEHLLEIRLDEGPIAEAEAYERLRRWAEARGLQTEPARPPEESGG